MAQDVWGSGPSLAEWSEFHLQVEQLPPRYRRVFDLVWYMGFRQREAAQTLGVTERSIQRLWREARLLLHRRLADADTTCPSIAVAADET